MDENSHFLEYNPATFAFQWKEILLEMMKIFLGEKDF